MNKKENKDWNGKSRGGAFGITFFVLLIKYLGVKTAYFFLSFILLHFIPFAQKATIAVWRYNRKILKYGRIKSILKLYIHYYRFGQTMIDKIAINNGLAHKYKFEFDDYSNFLNILDNNAAVIISGHIGNWEIGSQFFGEYAHKLNVVMYDAEYEKIKNIIQTKQLGYNIIPVNEGGIESILKIKNAIDKKQYVCFQGDRYVYKENTVKVNFMGKDTLFPIGPTLIASKFSVPVVYYFAMRENGMKYKFHFHIINEKLSQMELMYKYVEIFENTLKQYPQQWFNFYDVWNIE